MNKYARLGMYHQYQILEELQRMGMKIITVSGQPATPEQAKTQGGITAKATPAEFRQATQNLQDRGVDSDYDVCFFSEEQIAENRRWMQKNGFKVSTAEEVLDRQELETWPDEASAKRP